MFGWHIVAWSKKSLYCTSNGVGSNLIQDGLSEGLLDGKLESLFDADGNTGSQRSIDVQEYACLSIADDRAHG